MIETETRGSSRIVRLDRPEVRNALNAALVDALRDALAAAEQDADIRAVVLTGNGKDFCAGADLKVLQEIAARSEEENLADSRHLAGLFRHLTTSPLPVVAAVHGNALAGGCGLACVCDVVVAAEDSRFGFTEARIGFVAAIVARFLAERVGAAHTRELLLSARRFAAPEAQALGLVNQVVPAAKVLEQACEVAAGWSKCAASSLALTKKLLVEMAGTDLDEGLERAARLNAETRATADCKEGIAAFLEKRKPRWITPS